MFGKKRMTLENISAECKMQFGRTSNINNHMLHRESTSCEPICYAIYELLSKYISRKINERRKATKRNYHKELCKRKIFFLSHPIIFALKKKWNVPLNSLSIGPIYSYMIISRQTTRTIKSKRCEKEFVARESIASHSNIYLTRWAWVTIAISFNTKILSF